MVLLLFFVWGFLFCCNIHVEGNSGEEFNKEIHVVKTEIVRKIPSTTQKVNSNLERISGSCKPFPPLSVLGLLITWLHINITSPALLVGNIV